MLVPAVVLVLLGCGADPSPRVERPFSAESASPPGAATASLPPLTPAAPRSRIPSPNPSRTTDVNPVGDLPGWKHVFMEDFTAGDVPLGAFPGPLYRERWSAGYKDGTPDTAGQVSGGKSGYYPTKVLSVQNGVLDWFLHSEKGISMGAAPAPRIPNAAKNPPRENSLLYGRYSVRYRADSMPGFKTAWLLWPDSGIWPRDGEIDFPEGDLGATITAAAHFMSLDPKRFEQFFTDKFSTEWHVATTEWRPGQVEFFVDGVSIGVSTTDVPSTPMHLILQTESCLPNCPAPATQGHVFLDWISIWVPA
ncbi:hypothetical protein QFZ79_001595 [Arthrobacter sp. V4I6]|nr:hypothetical protein [Arthrobacter sp. V1I7]MDQ0853484.1 hypothetical protein [Arthrobacter sp. V4I6]